MSSNWSNRCEPRGGRCLATLVTLVLMLASLARAQQTPVPSHGDERDRSIATEVAPSTAPVETAGVVETMADEATFANAIDLSKLRALSLQDRQTVKTWDTFARQAVAAIAGRSSYDGREPLFTVLDMAFRPSDYLTRDVIRIKNVPLRKDFAQMPGLSPEASKKILETGYVSLDFWSRPDTQAYLQKLQQDAVWKSEAIGQVQAGASLLNQLMREGPSLTPMAFIPPAGTSGDWLSLRDVHANVPMIAEGLRQMGRPVARVEGYDDQKIADLVVAISGLRDAWIRRDATQAQAQIDQVATILPTLAPANYPSAAKRNVEVLYNKLYKLTLPGAALYFVAFVLFIMAAYSGSPSLRRWGVGSMATGFALHTVGIAIRWWLDQKSTGDWFHSIPIKNQFESVMFSAWFGVAVGLALEAWRKRSLFGAAAAFVGWMSLIALFTVPYVFGKDIGNEIGRSNGILMSYWLYIHVTLATASYALIGMSFLLGAWWIARYLGAPREVREMGANRLSADSVEEDLRPDALALSLVGAPKLAVAGSGDFSRHSGGAIGRAPELSYGKDTESVRAALARLDACNLVILQLAFWILAVAIVCGAVWADVSWGRPWGWDPKETFALVTWMVYLVILHVRLVTKRKAFWTAVLCVVGFFIMLFNWIGVNYFLVGLHSYA